MGEEVAGSGWTGMALGPARDEGGGKAGMGGGGVVHGTRDKFRCDCEEWDDVQAAEGRLPCDGDKREGMHGVLAHGGRWRATQIWRGRSLVETPAFSCCSTTSTCLVRVCWSWGRLRVRAHSCWRVRVPRVYLASVLAIEGWGVGRGVLLKNGGGSLKLYPDVS